jgi:TetR/AcrR family transcriptional regulator, fatty acid metabolism regulator protein
MTEKLATLRKAQDRHALWATKGKHASATDDHKRGFIETARRAQIIDCAIDAIAELGYSSASLAQIAKRAEISAGVILYYFRSKEELFQEVRAGIARFLDEVVLEHLDLSSPRTALSTLIEANVNLHAKHSKKISVLRQTYLADLGEANCDPSPADARRWALFAILEAGQKAGEFGPFEIWTTVRAITGALDVLALERLRKPAPDFDLYAKELVALVERAVLNDAKDHPASSF